MTIIKKTILLICIIIEAQLISYSQSKYFTRTGKILFYSKAAIEDIKAVNNQASCIYETATNRLIANVLISAFEFEKALMQQHFNENYLESEKFPKATFKGKLNNLQGVKFEGTWSKIIEFEGDMTIHGITRQMKSNANIQFSNGVISVTTEFYILLNDFNIKIPSTVINNISEKILVKINFKLNELKN
jgi:hypothetical protein